MNDLTRLKEARKHVSATLEDRDDYWGMLGNIEALLIDVIEYEEGQ